MRILMIRHGATALNAKRCYQGHIDVPLSAVGRQALCQSGSYPRKVYASPLRRARQTAEIIFPFSELILMEGFMEIDFGRFEGKSAREMIEDDDYRAWVDAGCVSTPPGGESLEQFSERVCRAVRSVIDGWYMTIGKAGSSEASVIDGNESSLVAFVVHGGTIMAALERFAVPHRDYFSWSTKVGCGFELSTSRELWQTSQRLRLEGTVSFLRESERRSRTDPMP